MTMYAVSWEIDIEADSPMEAAQKALEIQRDPESIATVFLVSDEEKAYTVDTIAETVEEN